MKLFNHMVKGEETKKRLPQRRLNFIDGMVSPYYGVLILDERLALICQVNEVFALMVDLKAECQEKKEEQKRKKEEESARLKDNRESKKAKEREIMTIALFKCDDIIEQLDIEGDAVFGSIKVADLNMMIRYEFNSDEYNGKGILKPELKSIAI